MLTGSRAHVQVTQLLRSMHLNKALCYTKIEAWEKGISAVNKVCSVSIA